MENELAVIAIKGGRFSEAENFFNQDLSNNPSSSSYFGLAICKLHMLLDVNRSVEEVGYCFEKAITLSEETARKDLILQSAEYLKKVLQQYDELYRQLEQQKKEQAKAAAIGAALTIGAAMIGSNNNSNAFTQIASLAAAGAGVSIAVDGIKNLGEIPAIQTYILETGENLINEFKRIGVGEEGQYKEIFNKGVLISLTENIKQDNKVAVDKTTLIICGIFGVARLYKRKWKSGILFLMTGGGYGIWYVIDLWKIFKDEFEPKW